MADLLMKSSERTSNYLWQNFQSVLNWTFILVVICTVVLVEGDEQCGKYVCKHGECRNQTTNLCECFRGWTGPSCEACGGRLELTARNGTIHEGYGNYTLDTKCSWLINGPPGTTIRLRFQHFATECSWDHLYIFDGTSVFDPLIAVLSGLVIPENADKTIPEIVVQSGAAYLHFYSDAAYNMSGFNITYRMDACPLDCSTRGTCQPDFTCRCDSGTTGEGCEFEECLNSCSGHGDCTEIGSKRRCQCHSGWRGMGCSIPLQKGVWEPVDLVDAPAGRASHKAVVQNNFMWIVSGDSFHGHPFQELAKFDLHSHRWTIMYKKLPDSAWPDQRYGHSVVIHQDTIYMFGGLRGKNITSDLWSFNMTTLEWKLVKVTEAESDDDSRKNEVIAVVAHTAHVYGNTMLVMFGHSPVYGYMNTVQECNLVNFTWSITKTRGAIVQGGYGHASVMDPRTDLVYVHAGYHSRPTATYHLTDHLYSYNPRTKEWIILRSSGQPKYLHSMVIISGLVLVFGGNTHNDTSHSRGAKCFSSNFLAYDIDCATWYTLDSPHLQRDISRFGHVSEVHDGSMYVFGGFNGLMLNDMYKYTPGQCESYNTEQECRNAHPGVRCVWAKEGQRCLLPDQARHKISLKTMTEFENPMCPAHPTTKELSEICQDFLTCPSCVGNNYTCVWWKDKCMQSASVPENSVKAHTFEECHDKFEKESLECPLIHNCRACQASPECHFIENAKCVLGSSHEIPHASGDTESKLAERNPKGGSSGQVNSQGQQEDMQNKGQTPLTDAFAAQGYDSKCKVPCYVHTSCENCTQESCMWCSNQQRCVDSNSYVASFPYGQCMEWTTQKQKCPGTRCRDLQTCDQCQRNPSCGWCDDGTNTGLGQCMEGGATGPYDVTDDGAEPNPGLCAVNQWYFTKCPLCQCNGHSTCYPNTSSCMGCEDLTTGLQCESCEDGYYGQATNGGNCTACECNGQADMCHPKTGKCFCRTRGTTGDRCDVCDEPHHYVGNPKNGGTCYYSLQIDFQFTFNLSKEDDKYYTEIKFMNTPPTPDRDVDFSINCSGKAYLNITVKSASAPAERTLLEGRECNLFKKKFSYKDYHFGKEENTTFLVYVYDFQTPFLLQISFSQFPQIDLVHFFVTFFSCFLSLLIIAAVFWKVKQRYDIFRRGQRIIVEMERMASRPFSVVSMEIGNNNAPVALKKEPPDYRASRRKSKCTKPSPIALEPIHGHKAAVLSLIVRLPTGDEDYTPSGQSGLCIGSALVTLGNPRKQSVEHSKGDKLKHKKHMASGGPGGPENCI